jgi:hypothetical protein
MIHWITLFIGLLGSVSVEMSGSSAKLLKKIYSGTPRNVFSLTTTGGGVGALSWTFTVPGASLSVMNANVPYSTSSLECFIQSTSSESFDGACNEATAVAMAEKSRQLAASTFLRENDLTTVANANIFGVACTAALVSDRPKKGQHRCHVAVATETHITSYTVTLHKGHRTRVEEDDLCSHVLLNAIAASSSIADSDEANEYRALLEASLSGADDNIVKSIKEKMSPLENIIHGRTKRTLYIPTKSIYINDDSGVTGSSCADSVSATTNTDVDDKSLDIEHSRLTDPLTKKNKQVMFRTLEDVALPANSLVYSGSFNPLHYGHITLAEAALASLSSTSSKVPKQKHKQDLKPFIVFEISASNADKPSLSPEELTRRLKQFLPSSPAIKTAGLNLGDYAICVSIEPLFTDKSRLYPNCNFVMGVDTFVRVIDPKYYSNCEYEMVAALTSIREQNVNIYVGGRRDDSSGEFMTMDRLLEASCLPQRIKGMFRGLSEGQFRADVSSTELREEFMKLEN